MRVEEASFRSAQLHAVIGENGAGKSTLLKIACGLTSADTGIVEIEGRALVPHTPHEAIARGVGMVQQHFALLEPLSVLENVMLGAEGGWLLDERAAKEKLAAVTRELGVTLDPHALVRDLGIGDRQRLEIARVLYKGARTIVLDEPTAVLVPKEIAALYETLKRLVSAGKTVIVVTHKTGEVTEHADTVTVMRKGQVVLARSVDTNVEDEARALTTAIMGGEPLLELAREEATLGAEVLALTNVTLGRALHDVTLSVRAGEIVGLAGIEGNGQRELVRVIAGLEAPDSGKLVMQRASVVHEDRQREGLVLDASVMDNALLGEHGSFSTAGFLRERDMQVEAGKRIADGGVEPHDLDREVRSLSGGNQQKIAVSRALARDATVLILSHPTRGVDIGAARSIHERVQHAAHSKAGVLLVSSDLSELRALAHRIVVMVHGRIVATVSPETSNEQIGELMLGAEATSGAEPIHPASES